MSNDFGNTPAFLLVYGKQAVEDRISIKITQLTRSSAWANKEELRFKFNLSGIEMKLAQDRFHLDWYINLLNPGPKNICSAISLTQTKCRYGGKRQWFECPGCQGRVGVLYKDKDDFKCRKCLDLDYKSHEINYKSLEPAIRNMHRANAMVDEYHSEINKFYNGKPTKKTISFEKLKAKSMGGFDYYGAKYLKEK